MGLNVCRSFFILYSFLYLLFVRHMIRRREQFLTCGWETWLIDLLPICYWTRIRQAEGLIWMSCLCPCDYNIPQVHTSDYCSCKLFFIGFFVSGMAAFSPLLLGNHLAVIGEYYLCLVLFIIVVEAANSYWSTGVHSAKLLSYPMPKTDRVSDDFRSRQGLVEIFGRVLTDVADVLSAAQRILRHSGTSLSTKLSDIWPSVVLWWFLSFLTNI